METASTDLCFVDCETTGLDPVVHAIWEVAIITRGSPPLSESAVADEHGDYEYRFLVPVHPIDLANADPVALDIGGFHQRHPQGNEYLGTSYFDLDLREDTMTIIADTVVALTAGSHLVGAVPSFDEERLRRMIGLHSADSPGWHYHLVDCEALAAGATKTKPPWDSEDLSRSVGVEPDRFDRHTALGDARWARSVYDAVMGAEVLP